MIKKALLYFLANAMWVVGCAAGFISISILFGTTAADFYLIHERINGVIMFAILAAVAFIIFSKINKSIRLL